MRRYTTPTHRLRVKGVDLTGYDVLVTYRQRETIVTVKNPAMEYDGTDTVLSVPMTQLQTGGFMNGSAQVQVNVIDYNGYRAATNIKEFALRNNLLDKVVQYAE